MTDSSHKRAPRVFEPPPWERDAFEELARKREAQEAADRELAEATARMRAAEAARAKAAAAGDDPVVAKARMLAEAELARAGGEGAGSPEAMEPTAVEAPAELESPEVKPAVAAVPADGGEVLSGLDEAEVEQMLARLSLEEPKAHATHDLAVWAGVLLVALGLAMFVMSIWWQRAGASSGAAMAQLLVQSLLVGGFGLGFAVLGGVIVYQSRLQARS